MVIREKEREKLRNRIMDDGKKSKSKSNQTFNRNQSLSINILPLLKAGLRQYNLHDCLTPRHERQRQCQRQRPRWNEEFPTESRIQEALRPPDRPRRKPKLPTIGAHPSPGNLKSRTVRRSPYFSIPRHVAVHITPAMPRLELCGTIIGSPA